MIQEVNKNGGQVTQTGHIINCHGGATCPYRDTPESQRQAEFARATSIWCEPRARDQLEALMTHKRFVAPELAIAWRAGSIAWEPDAGRLVVKVPFIDAVFGWSLTALMLTYFVLMTAQILMAGGRDWRGGGGCSVGVGHLRRYCLACRSFHSAPTASRVTRAASSGAGRPT